MGQSAAGAVAAGGVHGFVPALTSFVGREGALAEVAGLLERHRLVTVTGPGGSGKTRLAGEVASRVADRFADGVWLAELAAVRDPAQVPSVVAAALGVREQQREPTADAVARVLARQQVLLVLDNCEHVVGAAAELCAGLLAVADDVRVLATSREPLRVAGEVRYRLGPLGLNDQGDVAGAALPEAVVLFADRARRADRGFALDEQTGPVVARLVARLDGMPLAIELAAAWVEALGVAQLLERMDDRFGLLATGDRVAPDRQRSLAATVEWSYRLLDEAEQRVFRAVSVFPGPFTLDGAEAVAGPGAGPAVLRLVDCSLLAPPRTDPDGRSRYVMLETLRGYGAGLLAGADEAGADGEAGADEEAGAAAALAGYALEVAEQAAAGLRTGTGELAAARWLDAEDATMRQVLAWAMDHDREAASRLAVALAPWWHLRGRLAVEYPLLRRAVGYTVPGSDTWCAAQFCLGRMALDAADPAGALDHFTAIRDAVADRGSSRALADGLAGRSYALAVMDRLAEAADDGRHALAVAAELGYPAGQAIAVLALTLAAYYAGDFGGAVQLVRQAGRIAADDVPGWLARQCNLLLTSALIEAGDLAAAERSCTADLAGARDAGDLPSLARGLVDLADLDLRAGRLDDAAAHLRESIQVAARTGDRIDVFNALDWCGYLCAATGRHAEAVTVWAARTALWRHTMPPEPPMIAHRRHESLLAARQALGEDRAQAAEDRGAAMSQVTAGEYGLLLTAPGPQAEPTGALAGLSARERELVVLVAQGHTDAQIAAHLFISPRTVHSHLDRIRDKTGARRRADLTRLALTAGLV
jgi:predicted ATPase/DNA-binding CsgD family transcriptional regulator/tetratricopeptide (TPR) repeat protein